MVPRVASWIGTLLCLVGAASAETPPWLAAGERLSYEMTYLRLVAGTMVLQVAEPVPGGPIQITLRATSVPPVSRLVPIDDAMASSFDPESGCVVSTCVHTQEGRRERFETVEYDLEAGRAHVVRNDEDRGWVSVPVPVLDTLSSLYVLRTLPLAPGRAFRLDVQSGGTVYPLVVVVDRRERIRTTSGPVETLVVEPRFRDGSLLRKEGRMTLWVTTDPTHTPLRIRSELPFGSLTATLSSYQRPLEATEVIESACRPRLKREEQHAPETR